MPPLGSFFFADPKPAVAPILALERDSRRAVRGQSFANVVLDARKTDARTRLPPKSLLERLADAGDMRADMLGNGGVDQREAVVPVPDGKSIRQGLDGLEQEVAEAA